MNKYKGGSKMNPTIGVILLVAGGWLVTTSLITDCEAGKTMIQTVITKLYFKVIPFFIGEACLLSGLEWFGWI